MKIGVITDTHFGARGDSGSFSNYYRKFYENIFFPTLKAEGIKRILHCGDVYDKRRDINFKSLDECETMFWQPAYDAGMTVDVLVGNHDVYYKDSNDLNSPKKLTRGFPNVRIYKEPTDINIDGINIGLVPWISNSKKDVERAMEYLQKTKCQVLFGHLEIAGFQMDRGVYCDDGLDKSIFSRFDQVYSGHFHHRSTDGLITYLGNPNELTWMDYKDIRGFHIYDTSTRELTFIRNPYRIFFKVYYDDRQETFEQLMSRNFDRYEDTYVKVVVTAKQNAYWFDQFVDKIQRVGVADLTIIENTSEILMSDNDVDINMSQDPITLLAKHIEGTAIDVDKVRLLNFLKTLYIEAQQMEV